MSIDQDLQRISLQEEALQFAAFDAATAWKLGSWLREAAAADNLAVAIDITLAGAPLFYCALPGATPENADWIRRKKNLVARTHKSSYASALSYRARETTLEAACGAPLRDFALAGGCFPIRIRGSAAVLGTITVSGLPERDDHGLVVRAIADHLGLEAADVALPSESH